MIKVTGGRLRGVLKVKRMALAALHSQWESQLTKFEGEEKDPIGMMVQIRAIETSVAEVEELQAKYNLMVMVQPFKGDMSLEMAIKLVGGAGRIAKLWRDAAKGEKKERYGGRLNQSRDKDSIYAVDSVPKELALKLAIDAEEKRDALQQAIAKGNLTEIEFEDSVGALLS